MAQNKLIEPSSIGEQSRLKPRPFQPGNQIQKNMRAAMRSRMRISLNHNVPAHTSLSRTTGHASGISHSTISFYQWPALLIVPRRGGLRYCRPELSIRDSAVLQVSRQGAPIVLRIFLTQPTICVCEVSCRSRSPRRFSIRTFSISTFSIWRMGSDLRHNPATTRTHSTERLEQNYCRETHVLLSTEPGCCIDTTEFTQRGISQTLVSPADCGRASARDDYASRAADCSHGTYFLFSWRLSRSC